MRKTQLWARGLSENHSIKEQIERISFPVEDNSYIAYENRHFTTIKVLETYKELVRIESSSIPPKNLIDLLEKEKFKRIV